MCLGPLGNWSLYPARSRQTLTKNICLTTIHISEAAHQFQQLTAVKPVQKKKRTNFLIYMVWFAYAPFFSIKNLNEVAGYFSVIHSVLPVTVAFNIIISCAHLLVSVYFIFFIIPSLIWNLFLLLPVSLFTNPF